MRMFMLGFLEVAFVSARVYRGSGSFGCDYYEPDILILGVGTKP